jgi:predicted NAD/FAD-binding protein
MQGYKVCLFEAQPLLGGHCNTVRYGPNPQEFVDVGVVVYGNSSYWKVCPYGTAACD